MPPLIPSGKMSTLHKTESKPSKNKNTISSSETQYICPKWPQSPPLRLTLEEERKEKYWTVLTTGETENFTSSLIWHGSQDYSESRMKRNHQPFTCKEFPNLNKKPKLFQFQPTSNKSLKTWRTELKWTIRTKIETSQLLLLDLLVLDSCSPWFDWSILKSYN